ncbi:MAG: DinB family protein [bacterium]
MTTATYARPGETEFAEFYGRYVAGVPEGNIVEVLRSGGEELASVLGSIDDRKGGHRYADGKWTVRDVVGHLIDAERIFAYRALRIARGDVTPLASFDEGAFATAAGADARTVADLAKELAAVRASTLLMLEAFPDGVWDNRGTASGKAVSVRALAYIIDGHARHHLAVLRERYGV